MQADQKFIEILCVTSQEFFTTTHKEANIFATTVSGKTHTVVKAIDGQQPRYFLLTKELGKGTFGQVSVGIELNLDPPKAFEEKPVAIKITDLSQQGALGIPYRDKEKRESLHEKNCLEISAACFGYSTGKRTKECSMEISKGEFHTWRAEVEEAVLIMPLYVGQSMDAHTESHSYDALTLTNMACSFSDKLASLHAKKIVHSDLKPQNIIWDIKTHNLNIVDFNRAKILIKDEFYSYSQSSSDGKWMAPECSQVSAKELEETQCGYKYSQASDVYTAGSILITAYGMDSKKDQCLPYHKFLIKDFLSKMCSVDEKSRPSAKQYKDFFFKVKAQLLCAQADQTKSFLIKKIEDLVAYAGKAKSLAESKGQVKGLLTWIGATANSQEKYALVCKAITFLNNALLAEKLDVAGLVSNIKTFIESDRKISGVSHGSSDLRTIFEEIVRSMASKDSVTCSLPQSRG